MDSSATIQNYLKLITNLISLDLACVAALCALLQTDVGKTFNSLMVSASLLLFFFAVITGVVSLVIGTNLGNSNELNSPWFRWSFAGLLSTTVFGVLIFAGYASYSAAKFKNVGALDSPSVSSKTILVIPNPESDFSGLPAKSYVGRFDILLLPTIERKRQCN